MCVIGNNFDGSWLKLTQRRRLFESCTMKRLRFLRLLVDGVGFNFRMNCFGGVALALRSANIAESFVLFALRRSVMRGARL